MDALLHALQHSPSTVLLLAALLEMVVPRPSHLGLSHCVPWLTRLGHKVRRPNDTPRLQSQAGSLAILLILLPCAAGVWALRNLTLSEPLFDLAMLLTLIESRPLFNFAKQLSQQAQSDVSLPLLRAQIAPWLLRDCTRLSLLGLIKASYESCLLRFLGQWAAPLLGYLLAGIQGALFVRLCQLMQQGWNQKQPEFAHFGQPIYHLYQLLMAPAALLLAWPFKLVNLFKKSASSWRQSAFSIPLQGWLMQQCSATFVLSFGGPRYYGEQLVRVPRIGLEHGAEAKAPLRLLIGLAYVAWGWLALFLLVEIGVIYYG